MASRIGIDYRIRISNRKTLMLCLAIAISGSVISGFILLGRNRTDSSLSGISIEKARRRKVLAFVG
ncbi:hypothetical protein M569_07375, partial [Genlisea aurea]